MFQFDHISVTLQDLVKKNMNMAKNGASSFSASSSKNLRLHISIGTKAYSKSDFKKSKPLIYDSYFRFM